MSKQRILGKIKKLLAMVERGNEHESANAMRKAQALMNEHGLTDADVQLSDVGHAFVTSANAAKTQPRWSHDLAVAVMNAIGVEAVFSRSQQKMLVRFIGVGERPEVAAYCYQVLSRQLRAARKAFMATQSKRLLPATKTNRANLYCEGWIDAVQRQLHNVAPTEHEQALVAQYKEQLFGRADLPKADMRAPKDKSRDASAFGVGFRDGKKVQLNAGVNGQEQA
ncbi:DUF2786 domain-containing protein, partial [Aeromonas rivuli]|uniref:DUF2786 domain-containing protein n=1 Tax=Aeromonas rivuli TaxID=648794 RepID=UPI0005AAFC8F